MVNDSSLGLAAENFDFDTQSGVMHMLASVRASSVSPAQKNELRDLIFLYSNGGRDQSVRHSLEQKLTQYAVAAVPKPTSFTPPKIHEFGTSRPSPAFKAVPVSAAASQPVPKPAPINTASPAEPAPVAQVATPDVHTATPSAPADIPTNLPHQSTESVPEIKTAQVTPQASSPDSQEDSVRRIKEIKSLVNQKVGNPVNLVDINNEVGREYMAALLDAMKKINSGSSASSAMQRLESAYMRVQEALKNRDDEQLHSEPDGHTQSTASIPDETPAPAPVIEPEKNPSEIPAQPAQPAQSTTPPFSPIATEHIDHSESSRIMDSRPITPLSQTESQSTARNNPVPAAPKFVPVAQSSVAEAEPQQEPGTSWGPQSDTAVSSKNITPAPEVGQQQVVAPAKYQSASLAQSEKKLRTPDDLPTPSALETSSVAGDPLYTQQVDDGLNQLLTDWALFKKSGLFGTGPKGTSHPLYLKIKDLQIPLLLAGRFEGATQEIKQSVTDYMNGWRYEQGIIYEQGETFDHYLRRVIRHILDLQKKA